MAGNTHTLICVEVLGTGLMAHVLVQEVLRHAVWGEGKIAGYPQEERRKPFLLFTVASPSPTTLPTWPECTLVPSPPQQGTSSMFHKACLGLETICGGLIRWHWVSIPLAVQKLQCCGRQVIAEMLQVLFWKPRKHEQVFQAVLSDSGSI